MFGIDRCFAFVDGLCNLLKSAGGIVIVAPAVVRPLPSFLRRWPHSQSCAAAAAHRAGAQRKLRARGMLALTRLARRTRRMTAKPEQQLPLTTATLSKLYM